MKSSINIIGNKEQDCRARKGSNKACAGSGLTRDAVRERQRSRSAVHPTVCVCVEKEMPQDVTAACSAPTRVASMRPLGSTLRHLLTMHMPMRNSVDSLFTASFGRLLDSTDVRVTFSASLASTDSTGASLTIQQLVFMDVPRRVRGNRHQLHGVQIRLAQVFTRVQLQQCDDSAFSC